MNTKLKIFLVIVVVLVVLGWIMNFVCCIWGNPITKLKAKNAAQSTLMLIIRCLT